MLLAASWRLGRMLYSLTLNYTRGWVSLASVVEYYRPAADCRSIGGLYASVLQPPSAVTI